MYNSEKVIGLWIKAYRDDIFFFGLLYAIWPRIIIIETLFINQVTRVSFELMLAKKTIKSSKSSDQVRFWDSPESGSEFTEIVMNLLLISSLQHLKVCDSVTGSTKGQVCETVNFLRQPLIPEELYLGWITSTAQYNLTFGPQGSLTASLANDSVTVGLRPRWNRLKRTKHVFAVERWPGKTDLIKVDLIAGYDLTGAVTAEWAPRVRDSVRGGGGGGRTQRVMLRAKMALFMMILLYPTVRFIYPPVHLLIIHPSVCVLLF